jgi:hypothetical protein
VKCPAALEHQVDATEAFGRISYTCRECGGLDEYVARVVGQPVTPSAADFPGLGAGGPATLTTGTIHQAAGTVSADSGSRI